MSTHFHKAFIDKLESITALTAVIGANNVWTAPVDATIPQPYVTIELVNRETFFNIESKCSYAREIWGLNLYSTNIEDNIAMEDAILDELELVYNEKWLCYQVDLCKFDSSIDLTEIESDGSELTGQRRYVEFIIKRQTTQTTVDATLLLRSTELDEDYDLNDPVPTWRDASGNSYNATQANASQQPLYKTSPSGSAKGDANNDELSFNGIITPLSSATKGAIHLYVTGFNTGHGILTLNTTDNNTGLYVLINSADELDVVFFSNGAIMWQHKTDITPKATFDLKVIHNGTTPKIYKDDVDITNLTTTTDETAWFSDITSWNQAKIFVTALTGTFDFYGSGQISHCAIFNTNVTVEQMNCLKP